VRALLLPLTLSLVATGALGDARKHVSLAPCQLDGISGEVLCGTYTVAENPKEPKGRKIPLFVAVLTASERPAAPDPLFILAGGPGQGASSIAGFVSRNFAGVRRRRDIVLVDLAGTGRSQPLNCTMFPTPRDLVGDFYPIESVRACRSELEKIADLRRYTTQQLVDDLDQVRAALGYEQVNLYGTSYGSRAALEYVRRHGAHVRSMVLKAVAPASMAGTMHYAKDTERSLRQLFDACKAQPDCAAAYPRIEAELREVLARAERGELRGKVPANTGEPMVELPISRAAVATTVFAWLQSSNSAVRLPQLIHATYDGDLQPLIAAIVGYRRALEAGIGYGMHLSVMCTEDAPRMDPARAAQEDRGTTLGDHRVASLAAACREWPAGPLPPDHDEPVRSAVPALLISGTLDPNTNENWGEKAASSLSRATHVIIPNLSHAFSSIAECGADFITRFVEAASAEGIDFSCKDRVRLPPFPLPQPRTAR
jgi:pimeloyl-ACP methyl ester carboxylesterase